jgi:hypothetical protein
MHEQLSVPKSLHRISVQTKKANTTDSCFNGQQMMIDELGDMFSGLGDGTGISDVKEVLTRGVLETETCTVDHENKSRTMILTRSERKSQHIACTNLAMGKLAPAMASRWYKHSVPVQSRLGVCPVNESFKMKNEQERKVLFEAFQLKMRVLQALANFLWTMIRMELIPPINMSLVTKVASVTFNHLNVDLGCEVDVRDRERVLMMTSYVTMYYAINKVFFSGTVLEEGTPFDYTQLLLCVPYLISVPEHFYFALSSMHNVVADPCLGIVLIAIKQIIEEEAVVENRYAAPHMKDGPVNYNYYSIPVTMLVNNQDVADAVSIKITSHVSRETNHALSKNSVLDILNWMVNQKKECFMYDDAGMVTHVRKTIASAQIRRTGVRYGMEISRTFLDEMLNNKVCLVTEAIKHTVLRGGRSRIVMGMSMRNGVPSHPDISFPGLFKVIDVVETRANVVLEKARFKRHAMNTIFNLEGEEGDGSRFELCLFDQEEEYKMRWYAEIGWTRQEELVPNVGVVGNYPQGFIDAWIRESAPPAPAVQLRAQEMRVRVEYFGEEEE